MPRNPGLSRRFSRRSPSSLNLHMHDYNHQNRPKINKLKTSQFTQTFFKLLSPSEYTQIKRIMHYSHCKACHQQSVQRFFFVHDERIVQEGFQGNRHHFVHEQIEKVAVHEGRAMQNFGTLSGAMGSIAFLSSATLFVPSKRRIQPIIL